MVIPQIWRWRFDEPDDGAFSMPIYLTITSIARILDKSDRRDRCIYSRDLERDLNSHVSLPRPLSDFDLIEVNGKLFISLDELMAVRII